MAGTTLTPVLFMNAQTSAGTYGPFDVDYKYDEERSRHVSGSRVDVSDIIQVLLETVVPQYNLDGSPGTSIVVTATATVFTSANGTHNSCIITAPFSRIKIQKVGASGAATFVGII